jgi:hypothetical protein
MDEGSNLSSNKDFVGGNRAQMCVYCGAIFPLGGNGRLSLAAHFERAHGIKQVKKKIHLVRLGVEKNREKGATLALQILQALPPYSSNSPSPKVENGAEQKQGQEQAISMAYSLLSPLEPHLSPYTHAHALRPRRFQSKKELEHHLWQAHRIRYAHHYTTIRVNPRFWICRKCAEPWKTKYKLRRDIERHLKGIHNVDIGSDGKYQGIYYQRLVSGYLCKLCEAIREVKI